MAAGKAVVRTLAIVQGFKISSPLFFLPPHQRRNYFKRASRCCLQGRAAVDHLINAVGIAVVDFYQPEAHRAPAEPAVAQKAEIFKLRTPLTQNTL